MQVGLSCYVHSVVYNNKSVCDTQSCGKNPEFIYFLFMSQGEFVPVLWAIHVALLTALKATYSILP